MTVVFSADFEGVQPLTDNSDPGGSVALSSDVAFRGTQSLKHITPSTIYDRGSGSRCLGTGFQAIRRVVDVRFYLPSGHPDCAWEFSSEAWDGANAHLSSFSWIKEDAFSLLGWRYWGSGGSWVFFDESATLSVNTWHHLRAETNFGAEGYGVVTIDGQVFDLTGTAYQKTVQAATPNYCFGLLLWSQVAQAVTGYTDSFYVEELTPRLQYHASQWQPKSLRGMEA